MQTHSLAGSIGDTQFLSVLDRLHITFMSANPNVEALKHVVSALEEVAG